MDLSIFIGKKHEEIEKAFGFTHYLETMDDFRSKKRTKPETLVEALFRFLGNQKLRAVKTDDGTALEIFDISLEEAKKNLLLLQKDKGPLYDEDICLNYSILGENFYAFSHGVLMFSASEENAQKMAKILDECGIEYFKPEAIDKIKYIPPPSTPEKKPSRNEPCYCGSGKKYKKCCWLKEMNDKSESFWSEGEFAETMTGEEAKEKMKTFHKGHDEDMNFNCEKCNKKISAQKTFINLS